MKTNYSEARDKNLRLLIKSATNWWKGHRPLGWTKKQHLDNPSVNANYTPQSTKLAMSVARFEASKKTLKVK